MLSIIKPRGDIKTNWEAANPILRMREWGIEWETTVGVGDVKIKIGDGVTPWSTLDYVLVNDVTKKIVKTFAEVTAENPELIEGSSMDVLWATVKNKFEFLNQKVTDISENGDIDLTEVTLPTFTDYATDDTTMPDARTAINNITSSIKVPAFISNAKAALRGLVTLGEMRSLLVNSGLTTETGKYFLDAAYGKTLADQISQLNSQLEVKHIYNAAFIPWIKANVEDGIPFMCLFSSVTDNPYKSSVGMVLAMKNKSFSFYSIYTLCAGDQGIEYKVFSTQ